MCPRSLMPLFADSSSALEAFASVEECIYCNAWLQRAHGVATAARERHFLFCLSGLARPAPLTAIRCEAAFLETSRLHTLVQDVVLVVTQLWAAQLPWVVLLPQWEPSLISTLKSLPRASWTDSDACSLIYSVRRPLCPMFCFTFYIRCSQRLCPNRWTRCLKSEKCEYVRPSVRYVCMYARTCVKWLSACKHFATLVFKDFRGPGSFVRPAPLDEALRAPGRSLVPGAVAALKAASWPQSDMCMHCIM